MDQRSKPIRAVVFDLDDTLYGESQYVRSGYRAVAAHLQEKLNRQEPFDDWLWSRFQAGKTQGAFDALSEQFALSLTAGQIQELIGVYREHRPEIELYPGVAEMLPQLRRRWKLGLLSDGFLPAQRLKVAALGVEEFFDAIVLTEQMGRDAWKPSPLGFEAIRTKLDAPHETCAYVADNPAKDFIAPNELGWLTIQWVRDGQIHAAKPAPPGGEPQQIVRCRAELESALT